MASILCSVVMSDVTGFGGVGFQWKIIRRGLGVCIPGSCNTNDAEFLIKSCKLVM